ncbi:Uncharacterised protein [Bordetella pertussis]|nr:Uncharacterised protein [Bordetella pertussis]
MMRPTFRVCSASRRARLSSPTRALSGTTRSSLRLEVWVPRMPILSDSSSISAPGCSLSTMKADTPRPPAAGSVLANTT